MAARLSKGLRNYINSGGGLKDALQGGKCLVYSGPQPASADLAPTGTLLCTFTEGSGAHTAEVQATGSVTLSGTSAGSSLDGITVAGVEILGESIPYTTSFTETARLACVAINANPANVLVKAANNSSATITLTARRGLGAQANGLDVTSSKTVMTTVDVNLGSGVTGVSSVNGLKWNESAAGVLTKLTGQTVTGVAVADGSAGYARFVGSVADSGALDSTESQIRMDLAIATSGSQMNMTGSTTIASGSTQTMPDVSLSLPTA